MMGKIISIANQKGGVGKTTTSVNLSASLGVLEKKVLLIDADPQGNASTGIGISYESRSPNLYDLIVNESLDLNSIKKTIVPGLDIITSNTNLAASEIELTEVKNREFVLSNLLSKIEGYDYILIDCPPALGLLTINALVASNSIIIPLQSEFFALEGISSLVNSIELIRENFNPSLVIEGILLTMVDKRNSLSSLVEKDVRNHFGKTVYKTTIPRNVRISEAPSHGKPAILYDVNSSGSMAYIGLAREILEKQGLKNSKENILKNFIEVNSLALSNDVFWYVVDSFDNNYVILIQQMQMLSLFNKKIDLIWDIEKITFVDNKIEINKIFFNIFKENKILTNTFNKNINSLSDFYIFFNSTKSYLGIIKNSDSNESILYNFPKYLFAEKEVFLKIYNKIDKNKLIKIYKNLSKAELLIRQNSELFLVIGLRFFLNLKKIITS